MEESVRYWLLTTEYPPFFGGGISTYCRETVQMLTAAGYAVSVFLPDRSVKQVTTAVANDVRVIRFNPLDYEEQALLGYETLVSFAFARVLEGFITREGAPLVIESQEYNGIAYFTLLHKKLLYPAFKDLKILVTIHAPSFICLPYNQVTISRLPYFWIGEMEKFCLKAADLVIAPSVYMAEQILEKAPEAGLRYTQLSNPFHILPAAPSSTAVIREKEFVFYGKLSPLKGIFELLQEFKPLWNSDPAIKLRLIGGVDYYYHPEGKLMGDMVKAAYAAYIEKGQLVLEGEIPPERLREGIHTAHAVIIPSRVDNLPYAVLECMSIGKVVLGSTSGGHRELLEDGKNGFLFSHTVQGSFQEKIKAIIALDRNELSAIGQRAADTVKTYCNPGVIAEKKRALIKEMVIRGETTPLFPFLRQQQLPQQSLPQQLLRQQPGESGASHPASPSPDAGLLSVVVPYYNMGSYVEETIRSIQASGYSPLEIIVVNDGSTEKPSLEKLQLLEGIPGVRVLHKRNEGLSLARNTGAREARGEFLAFLDPDDTIEPAYYPRAVEVLKHYDNVYFAGAWVRYFGENEGGWPCFTPEPPFVLYHNMINTSGLVYKKAAFLQYGLNDRDMLFGMEDYDSLLSLLENGCSGVAFPEPFFNYRVRKGSMARQFTSAKILFLYQLLAVKHSKFYSRFAAEIVSLLNSNGQGFLHDNPSLDLHIAIKSRIIKKIIGKKGIEFLRKSKRLKKRLIQIQRFLKI